MTYKITLPIPHKSLSPNHTVGSLGQRMQKANTIKKYRWLARLLAMEQLGTARPQWKTAQVQVTWFSKTARLIDRDNILGYLKSAFDGLTDAGLLADDRDITHLPPVREKDAALPRVEITITSI